ncbi:MAG: BNR-4 repeat-containing protein, partial [Planctomycetota bacterium]
MLRNATDTSLRLRAAAAALLATTLNAPTLLAQGDVVNGTLINIGVNGAWSWFEDERIMVDKQRGRILLSACADGSGVGGSARSGDIDLWWLDLSPGTFGYFELNDRLEDDDHNSAALLVRPDGKYLAVYGRHNSDNRTRWRVCNDPSEPASPTSWTPESTYTHNGNLTYSNVYQLSSTGRVYNFCRANNFDPNLIYSDDDGSTWTGGTFKLLTQGGSGDRPYLRYGSDDISRVHFIATEEHPRDFNNSIYHGYVENNRLHRSDGTVLDSNLLDASAVSATALTPIFKVGNGPSTDNPFDPTGRNLILARCWTIDMDVDDNGELRALFTARIVTNGSSQDTDHRLFLAHYDGTSWNVEYVCAMGAYLYSPENDYTGLASLHPEKTDTLYVSTEIHPVTGASLAHYEIFKGVTPDRGATWSWTAITENSSMDNLRPIVPSWDAERTAVFWMRGNYTTYRNYDLALVGIVEAPEMTFAQSNYVDATTSNTSFATGTPIVVTGPASGMGPGNDGIWNIRTGFGNNSDVWTVNENGVENVPAIRTTANTGQADQLVDVWVQFWSNSDDWRIQAGFSTGTLRQLTKYGAACADPNDFTGPIVNTGSTVQMY